MCVCVCVCVCVCIYMHADILDILGKRGFIKKKKKRKE